MSSSPTRWIACGLVGCSLAITSGGCVAMNIPSQRLFEPEDRGGLFGSWKGKTADWAGPASVAGTDPVAGIGQNVANGEVGRCNSSIATDPSIVDHFGADLTEHLIDEPPTGPDPVPWPRYHPIPTRPAFSPLAGGQGPY